jgi:hypothetical protein
MPAFLSYSDWQHADGFRNRSIAPNISEYLLVCGVAIAKTLPDVDATV